MGMLTITENAELETLGWKNTWSMRDTEEGRGAQLLEEFARLPDESGERRANILNQSKLI
jgi:hypothetical protein